MQCRTYINTYLHFVLLCSGVLSRDSNMNRAFRSKKGDAKVLVLKRQVCVILLLEEKMESVTKVLSIGAAKEER